MKGSKVDGSSWATASVRVRGIKGRIREQHQEHKKGGYLGRFKKLNHQLANSLDCGQEIEKVSVWSAVCLGR